MSEYDDLLAEARSKGEAFRATARPYITKMLSALRNEGLSLSDARDRIQKDCVNIWRRRTILEALPDEAKNPEKQKSGRLGQKKRNSAAETAAPEQQLPSEEIVIDAQGRTVEDNRPSTQLQSSTSAKGSNNGNDVRKSQLRELTSEIKSDARDCSSCRELRITIKELSEALTQTTKLSTADSLIQSDLDPKCGSPSVRPYQKEIRDTMEFEFYMLFGDLRLYMAPLYPKIGDAGKVWFSGQIDKNTGKVLFVRPGRIGES